MRRTLALVFGGNSPEHDVSLISARGILENLDPERYEVLLVGVTREGRPILGGPTLFEGGLEREEGVAIRWPCWPGDRFLRHEVAGDTVSDEVDVVFPIIHGSGGEDGSIQGLCSLAGLRCVGAGVLGSALAMDKDRSRRVLAAEGIPVVRDAVVGAHEAIDDELLAERVRDLEPPLFVKPARAGSSVGVSRVERPEDLARAVSVARAFDPKVVIEEEVASPREIELAVLGGAEPSAAGPGEIEPHGEFYDYRAKYEDPESRLLIPAPIDEGLAEELRRVAIHAFRALDLEGMARVDFLVSRDDGAYILNEVNTLPGFTPISMYPKLWEHAGMPYAQLIDRLIELARVP